MLKYNFLVEFAVTLKKMDQHGLSYFRHANLVPCPPLMAYFSVRHQNQALACVTVPPARGHIVSFCPTSKKEKKDKKEKQSRRLGTLSPAMEGILVAIFSSHGGLGAKIFLSPGHQCPGDAGCRVSAHVHHCGLD